MQTSTILCETLIQGVKKVNYFKPEFSKLYASTLLWNGLKYAARMYPANYFSVARGHRIYFNILVDFTSRSKTEKLKWSNFIGIKNILNKNASEIFISLFFTTFWVGGVTE